MLRLTSSLLTPPSICCRCMHSGVASTTPRVLGQILAESGLDIASDSRLSPLFTKFRSPDDAISSHDFVELKRSSLLLERALHKELIIPDWRSFSSDVRTMFDTVRDNREGESARYIPQLARVNPDLFGVALCSIDGQRLAFGDSSSPFSVQSCSKVVSYCMALEENGQDAVHQHVGREPSGRNFNELVLNKNNIPHNPYLNSGAIMTCSLIGRKMRWPERIRHVLGTWSKLAGDKRIGFDNATYLSESATADRNFTLGYMMREANVFPEGTDLQETLQFYFMLCSIETSAQQLAVVAATLANGGVCPTTGRRVFEAETVRNALSLMQSCGMYDYSGQYAFEVGFPAKSGVAGGIMAVIPGVAGFCTYSPRLDAFGNSVRGLAFCKALASKYKFHTFDILGDSEKANPRFIVAKSPEDDQAGMLAAAQAGDLVRLQQLVARGCSRRYANYDGRTALHLAAAEGRMQIVEYLVAHGANVDAKDNNGRTAAKDAEDRGFTEIATFLNQHAGEGAQDAEPSPEEILELESGIVEEAVLERPKVENSLASQAKRIFDVYYDRCRGTMSKDRIVHIAQALGLSADDSRLSPILATLPDAIGEVDLATAVDRSPLLLRMLQGQLVIPDFPTFAQHVKKVFAETFDAIPPSAAKVADYIPELASVDPQLFGVAICTVDGQRMQIGDANVPFTAQHCSNVLSYCAALEERGEKMVHTRMGREPSGQVANYLILNHQNKAHNPFTNAGALAACSLIGTELPVADRYDMMVNLCRRAVGNSEAVGFALAIFLSEYQHADRNRCLLYHMREKGTLPPNTNIDEVLQLYLMMCSIEMDCASMSVLAATLASGGICPRTGERVLKSSTVRACLSIMSSCGMYDWSGDWQFLIGLPAAAGASGIVMVVIPNMMGFTVYSPPLNKSNISLRGIDFSRRLTDLFSLHPFQITSLVGSSVEKKNPLLWRLSSAYYDVAALCEAAAKNDVSELRSILAHGVDVNMGDSDGRTALHVAASRGHLQTVLTLINAGGDPTQRDRWGATALDSARQHGHSNVVELLALQEPLDVSVEASEDFP